MNQNSLLDERNPEAIALQYPTRLSIEPPPINIYPNLPLVPTTNNAVFSPIDIDPPAYPGQLQITYPRRSLTPVPQNQSVRPRVIRPPTPNLSLYPALLPPIKRSRSADSPPTSPISTALTTYHSEESLPNEKRNKLVNNIILYQYAVNNSQTTINNVQIQISNSIDKKQTQQLQQLIRVKRSEHKKLKKQLRTAEKQIATLEKDTIKLNSTTETTVQVARYQTENLDYQLKVTQEEKSVLATNLQTSLIENSKNKTSFQKEIAASKQREIALQAEAKDLHNQVTELLTRLESYTKTNSEKLTSISLENQETKAEVNRTQIKLNEAQNTITNLQKSLADSNLETTTINTHYKQQLLQTESLKKSNTNLKQEILEEKEKHSFLQTKHNQIHTLYTHAISVASNSTKDEFAESNKQLLNDIERVTTENIKYEGTIRNLKQDIAKIRPYVPAYETLQNKFKILEETNYNLQQQNFNLDANLQNSKLAHQEALQLLHERDDQDVSFASADLTSDQEEQQNHQENQQTNSSPIPHISNFFVQEDTNAVLQPPETQIAQCRPRDFPNTSL